MAAMEAGHGCKVGMGTRASMDSGNAMAALASGVAGAADKSAAKRRQSTYAQAFALNRGSSTRSPRESMLAPSDELIGMVRSLDDDLQAHAAKTKHQMGEITAALAVHSRIMARLDSDVGAVKTSVETLLKMAESGQLG